MQSGIQTKNCRAVIRQQNGDIITYSEMLTRTPRICVKRKRLHQSLKRFSTKATLFAKGNLVLCPLKRNDVFALQKMMLTASGQTMLCPADTNTKNKSKSFDLLLFFGSFELNDTN